MDEVAGEAAGRNAAARRSAGQRATPPSNCGRSTRSSFSLWHGPRDLDGRSWSMATRCRVYNAKKVNIAEELLRSPATVFWGGAGRDRLQRPAALAAFRGIGRRPRRQQPRASSASRRHQQVCARRFRRPAARQVAMAKSHDCRRPRRSSPGIRRSAGAQPASTPRRRKEAPKRAGRFQSSALHHVLQRHDASAAFAAAFSRNIACIEAGRASSISPPADVELASQVRPARAQHPH